MEKSTNEMVLRVAETVAEALETPIDEIPPLSEVIDPDALDALLGREDVTVSFRYANLSVIVQSGGIVYAYPIRDDPEEPAQWGHLVS